MPRLVPLALCALAVATLARQRFDVEKYRLDNGLTVILNRDASAPQVCVNLWYGVGSKDEPAGRSGFAHLFEHLMFMGTERVPEGDFDRIMETGGGFNNATTSADRTNYFDFGPSELLPTLLWLEADRLEALGEAMTEEKLELQRQVVMNERRQNYENAPYGEVYPTLQRLLYPPGHPYHHTTIGSMEDLAAATLDDVVDFFDTYYVPNNASLVVAGDFDPAAVRVLVEELFGTLPRGPAVVHTTAEPVQLEREVRARMTDDVQFAKLVLAFHGPPRFAPGDAEMALVGALLSEGISGRLVRSLVVEDELALEVEAYPVPRALGSMFVLEALVRPGVDPADVERGIDRVLAELREEGPTAEELERVQATHELAMLSGLESLLARADLLNEYEFFLDDPTSLERDLQRYRGAAPKDVRRAAQEVLDPVRRVVLTVHPEDGAEVDPRDARPALAASPAFRALPPDGLKLSNGIELFHWERHDLPLARVALLLDSGAADDGPGRAGLAHLVGEMLDEGTGERSAIEFQAALERLGADLDVDVDHGDTLVTLTALARNLGPALDLVADAVRAPAFDREEWARVHDLHVQELLADQDEPGLVARRAARHVFFGDGHPWAWPVVGTPTSARHVDRETAVDFHAAHYRPSRVHLVGAGAIAAEELRALCERAFGDWAHGPVPLPPPHAVPERGPEPLRVRFVDRPGAVQTAVRLVLPAPPRRAEGRVAREVLGVLLGGSFTSRLNANLREEHGYTYGARAGFTALPRLGWFEAATAVRADVTGASVRELLHELGRLRGGDVTPPEASKACAVRRTELVSTQSQPDELVEWAAERLAWDEPWSSLTAELAALEALTAAELNALAEASLPLDLGVLLLVGDGDTIRSAAAALGLPAPVEVAPTGEAVAERVR